MSATPLAAEPQSQDHSEALAAAAPFADLPPVVLKSISEICERREYPAGEAIFSLGQYDGAEFYLLLDGRLKGSFVDPDSGEMHIDQVEKGGFFGLAGAIAVEDVSQTERMTLTAESDATVLAIDSEAFRGVVAQRPTLTRNLMHYFAGYLSKSGFQAPAQEASPERRVFAALLEHVERDPVNGDWRITKMPKHRELAEKSGADEAATAGAIAQLIQDGVARRDYPGLVIEDMAKLNQLAR